MVNNHQTTRRVRRQSDANQTKSSIVSPPVVEWVWIGLVREPPATATALGATDPLPVFGARMAARAGGSADMAVLAVRTEREVVGLGPRWTLTRLESMARSGMAGNPRPWGAARVPRGPCTPTDPWPTLPGSCRLRGPAAVVDFRFQSENEFLVFHGCALGLPTIVSNCTSM
jgi:hypothetical protein